ncbi:amino acid adenylation domain-containing protein [Bariatricus sp. HCP28S3_D3]|uniref:amino acid adenylation domain-containing protein n=1 Tax=Bariatricus sp. HCP28S3_D3 TaxID=3438901 RepID=UPI003F8ADF7B
MEYFHLTTPQKNIWNLQKYYDDTAVSNLCGAIFYNEKRDNFLLKQALCIFIRNHSGIRLCFSENDEEMQYVSEKINEDIPDMTFASMEEFDRYAEKYAKEPIKLTDKFLYRFMIIEVEGKSGVLVVLSHLISDAWTFSLMANQVDAAYHNLAEGEESVLLESNYTEYIHAEKNYLLSDRYKKDKLYWEEKYATRPEKSIIKISSSNTESIEAKRITKVLSSELEHALEDYCKTNPVTPAVLFETALIIYLSQINQENKSITIGVPVLNRSNAKEKKIAGMFVSTMPLTVNIMPDMTVEEFAGQITKGHMDIFRHQKYPYADILKNLREKQNFSGNLYDVMISYQNAKTDTGADTKWYSNGYSEVPFVIHIDNRDKHSSHTINVDYQSAVFKDEREVAYIIERLEYILKQITEAKITSVKEIDIIPHTEKTMVLEEFNDTYVEYPKDKCIHELFTEQAAKTPDRIALIAGKEKFTYRELDEKTNSLAQWLISQGVEKGKVVGAYLDRTAYTVISQLAVLKAGGVFLPIDHRYPNDRIEYMLKDCNVELVITDKELGSEWNVKYINLKNYGFKDVLEMPVKVSPDAPCYVIYTSGSTGRPKGCVLKHMGVSNFCANNNIVPYAEKLEHRTVVSVNTISFDFFIAETLLPLAHGWMVVLANDEESSNKKLFKELVVVNDVNIIETTPTRLEIYTKGEAEDSYFQQIQLVVSAGEALSDSLLQQIRIISEAKIYNPLGPSECSVWNVDGDFKSDITIGSPIANTQIYILDKDGNILPIGVAGELCIAGDGVGMGYLNRPELTAEKFVPNPFATEENHHGKVMYHTGDLARWRADGEIEYLGRIDTQVKIRGLRIELGEIESVMSSFAGIQLTAVADKRDENNRQYLVGYYTAEGEIDEKELRSHLSSKLPKYMVPNYFVKLDVMPMTASGKTDRKNLPLPDFTVQINEYVAPETDIEKKLAAILQSLLHIEQVGKTDDFFELGGDSLLAITMLNEIADTFHSEVSMKDIMEHTTLEQLAQCVENADNMVRIPITGKNTYTLLPQQKAIYAAHSKSPDSLLYNMPARVLFPEGVDIAKLKESILNAIKHHKILMSYIKPEGDEIVGVYDYDAKICFEKYNTEDADKFVRPFDLSKAPLVRVGFTEKELLFDMHHIVSDGETLNIILSDILKEYEGMEVQDEQISYADYAEYFYSQDMTRHADYFREQLKCDFEPVVLPETKQPGEGGNSKVYQITKEIVAIARDYGKRHNLTDTMVFWGAYGILLSKYSGNKNVLSSIVLKNRIHADTKDMAGMFVNTLPVYLSVNGTVTEYMQEAQALLLGLFEHQELPFASIADAVGMTDKGVVNTSFVYQADGEKSININGQKLIPELVSTHMAKFELMMELTPCEDGMKARLEYNCEKYDEALMDRLMDAYFRILLQLDKENVADIEVMSSEEYHKVLEEFNDTYVEYPKDKCIHELFTEQAEKTPNRIALVFEDEKFTYRQLDEMSNSLAYYLREKGVKTNDVVPIIAKRSWHVIVAMLGILKAGGAYMPVSPEFPSERMNYMFETADVNMVLTYECSINSEDFNNKKRIEKISLDEVNYFDRQSPIENRNEAEDTCYVIFTSGSTGQPKGVAVNHRNVSNYCHNNNNNNVCHKVISEGNESIVSVTNIVFDIFVTESLLPLVNGLTVYMANDEEIASQNKLSKLIRHNRIDVIQTTPTKMKSYMLDCGNLQYFSELKTIILGGEALPEELYQDIASCSRARVFNIYGPAETTVWSTNKEMKDEKNWGKADITIGSPIANTQIYILDKDGNILPIGVAGELCIAGDGVGMGYLNRSKLTAEKFVPNPFATEENHHGKVMYHTGDLARWRADGEIEYLGRIDTQVKIRGLRIELGEIESVMSSFTGIQLTAVADKRDENNRQYLVGYYTAEGKIDEKELRSHLSLKLPKYMVPNYFVKLDVMPMTASGKTDRKNLPLPDFTVQTSEYVAPKTEQEMKLCNLLKELLHTDRVGVEDDFFEYGGDSLTAIEYVAKAHSMGIDFALQNVFDFPTVRKMCSFLNGGVEEKVHFKIEDFDKYREIFDKNEVDDTINLKKKSLGNILLTGATGFLGAHILDRLMQEENGKIYCLIRSNKTDDRRGRLQEILRYYFGDKYESEWNHRIIPVVGDIEREGLADCMPSDIQTVIHTAASVKHFGSYSYFHKVNAEGTGHVVDYAKAVGAKLIHISTLSVSGNSMADDFTVYRSEEEKFFYETSFYIGQPLDNVYIHSKFEAERKVYDAMLKGLDALVIRVGNLTNRASDYKFQPNFRENAFLTRVKAILEFGLFPDYLMKLYAEFSPIDKTAEGIVKIAQYADKQTVFHLNSDRVIYFDRFLKVVHELGISMEVVSGSAFNEALQKTIKQSNTEYIFEAFQNDMDEQGQLVYDSNIRIKNDFTLWFLKKVGFEWNETDMEYIKGYIDYFREIGYLEV